MRNPLIDHTFLKQLDAQRLRVTYAKIISLNLQEEPIEEISGRVINGTINVDGNSVVRRTCNLTFRADENTIVTNYYWTLKTKFKMYIGLQNNINPNYPDIIWFPMGIYVINQFTCSHTTNNLTITINGKDKMSLLNGDLGGLFTGSVDLGTKEEIQARYEPGPPSDDVDITPRDKLYCNTTTYKYYKWNEGQQKWEEATPSDYIYIKKTIPIKDILFYMLRTFGGEETQNLIINDLDDLGVELLTYRADKPLYYYYQEKAEEALQPTYDGSAKVKIELEPNIDYDATVNNIDIFESWTFLQLTEEIESAFPLLWVRESLITDNKKIKWPIQLEDLEEQRRYVLYFKDTGIKDENGKAILEEYLTYSQDDKQIVIDNEGNRKSNIDLGEFEPGASTIFHFKQLDDTISIEASKCYYYDNDETNDNEVFYIYRISKGDAAGFRSTLITYPGDLIANAGESVASILDKITKALGNFEYFYDLQGRFVFQRKKIYLDVPYTPIDAKTNNIELVTDNTRLTYTFPENNFFVSVSNAPAIQNLKNDFIIWGQRKTLSGTEIPVHMRYAIHKKPVFYKNYNNEEYYTAEYPNTVNTSNIVDWREIIYQMALDYQRHYTKHDFTAVLIRNNYLFYPTGRTGYEQFYEDMIGFWREIYNPYPTEEEKLKYTFIKDETSPNNHFNMDVVMAPQNLNFWIDFLDVYSVLGKYSVLNIGDRQKVTTDNTVKAIHFKQPPQVIFQTPNGEKNRRKRLFIFIYS